MNILEVNTAEQETQFLRMPQLIYRDDRNYIRPLDQDIREVFDPSRNPMFKGGDCKRWLLLRDGEAIGRIAAFFDSGSRDSFGQPTGGCGFFECIDDQPAAHLLFNTAKNWLEHLGFEAMEGPVNFGSRERWWGLLVDGFVPPCYCANYQPVYYRDLFESYGFEVFFKQYTYIRQLKLRLDNQYLKKAERILGAKGYLFAAADKTRLDKAATDFRRVYNQAWVNHTGVEEMDEGKARQLMKTLKPVIDPRMLWFAYYEGEPVGFFISIPDVNELMVKDACGKVGLRAILSLLWNKHFKKGKTLFGIVFGVVPAHQRKGVEVAMISTFHEYLFAVDRKGEYESLQMNWIGDFNPKMMNLLRQIDAEIYKTHHTYRYLFDREKPFERHPVI